MSNTVRSIRAQTNKLLNQERIKATEQIHELEENYKQQIRKLEIERDDELAKWYQKLQDLEIKHRKNITLLEQQIDIRFEEERAKIQKQITILQKETEQKLQNQKILFERKLRELYDYIDERINELMTRIDLQEKNEQLLAYELVTEAKTMLKEVQEEKNVQLFSTETVEQILKPMVNKSILLYNSGKWVAATSSALLASTESKRVLLEAQNAYKIWYNRTNVVCEKLEKLKSKITVFEQENACITHLGVNWHGCLRIWSEEKYQDLSCKLSSAEASLRNIEAGRYDVLDGLDVELTCVDCTGLIDSTIEYAERGVHAYIIAYKILCALKQATGIDWEEEEGGEIRMEMPESRGDITLINDDNDELIAKVSVRSRGREYSNSSFDLTVSYCGTRTESVLVGRLGKIISALKTILISADYGHLQTQTSDVYIDANGYPAVHLTIEHNTMGDILQGVEGLSSSMHVDRHEIQEKEIDLNSEDTSVTSY